MNDKLRIFSDPITKMLLQLWGASALTGLLCALMGDALKKITDNYEGRFSTLADRFPVLYFVFPLMGLTVIFLLRKYLFRKKENKGIKEIFNTLSSRHNELPAYKIPSHFVNGLLTVAFGGSTGIEVSTVVASATVGSMAQKKGKVHVIYRKELIAAGVAAGITALFNSPVAGILFALEVIYRKPSVISVTSMMLAVGVVWGFNFIAEAEPIFHIAVSSWNYYALPYFILLGVFAGLHSVYFTRTVLLIKKQFARIDRNTVRVLAGSLLIGIALFFFPALYGDGYHAMKELFSAPNDWSMPLLLSGSLLLLKPLITSITLAAGGDGGVFAPSLFLGAFLGGFVALAFNTFFNVGVIPANFMVVGMAAMLSGCIHAPFTSIFLVCALTGNYILFIPAGIAALIARFTAGAIYPYTVYSLSPEKK